jgi:GxxExxY protein
MPMLWGGIMQGLGYQREMEMSIYYEGVRIGTRRVDFFVEEAIMVEMEAVIRLEDVHLAQAMNYCQASKFTNRFIDKFRC